MNRNLEESEDTFNVARSLEEPLPAINCAD